MTSSERQDRFDSRAATAARTGAGIRRTQGPANGARSRPRATRRDAPGGHNHLPPVVDGAVQFRQEGGEVHRAPSLGKVSASRQLLGALRATASDASVVYALATIAGASDLAPGLTLAAGPMAAPADRDPAAVLRRAGSDRPRRASRHAPVHAAPSPRASVSVIAPGRLNAWAAVRLGIWAPMSNN